MPGEAPGRGLAVRHRPLTRFRRRLRADRLGHRVTLNTSVSIGAPTDVVELFHFCRELLGAPAGTPFTHDPCDSGWRRGQRQIHNPPGIGLPAWLWIYYGADGPFRPHEHDHWCPRVGDEFGSSAEDVASHERHIAVDPIENGWTVIEVTFDTAYGYTGSDGESCSDLHARLITALGRWLDARGLPWKWQNEYTGDWFDRYDGLDGFGDAHRTTGAAEWFDGTVAPLIRSLGGGAA